MVERSHDSSEKHEELSDHISEKLNRTEKMSLINKEIKKSEKRRTAAKMDLTFGSNVNEGQCNEQRRTENQSKQMRCTQN